MLISGNVTSPSRVSEKLPVNTRHNSAKLTKGDVETTETGEEPFTLDFPHVRSNAQEDTGEIHHEGGNDV